MSGLQKSVITLSIGVVFFLLLYLLEPILAPFLVAGLLAYLGDPLVESLSHRGYSRTFCVILVFLLFFLLTALTFVLIVPLLSQQLASFANFLPDIINWFDTALRPFAKKWNLNLNWLDLNQLKILLSGQWQHASGVITGVVAVVAGSTFKLFHFVANVLLIFVVSFYLLRDWQKIVKGAEKILPRAVAKDVVALVVSCNLVLGAFFRGQLWVMLTLGVVYAIGLWFVGLPMALLVGALAGLVSIVPYLGAIVGLGSAIIIGLFHFGMSWHLLGIAAVFLLGQMLEGMWLTPTLVGDRIGLHPVAVIFALLLGGQWFGFVGILLALPVAAVVMVLIKFFYQRYRESEIYS